MSKLEQVAEQVTKRKILTLDIERLPGLAPVWDQKIRGAFIPVSKWRRMPSMLCAAFKWHDQRQVEFLSRWDDEAAMIQRSWELVDEADIIVGYWSKAFDMKHLKTFWMVNGLPQPRPWKNVDMCIEARKNFALESYSLDNVCRVLGIPGKRGHYSELDAEAAVNGDEPAQRRMRRYNVQDVRATENVYDTLLGWISTHPHVTASMGDDLNCNRCGSKQLSKLSTDYLAVVLEYAMYRCDRCKGIVRAGHTRRVARTRGVGA